MKSHSVFRALGNENWINKKTNPTSVSSKAFLRKPKDVDGVSVFDEEDSCYALKLSGTATIPIQELLQLENPLNRAKLKLCYDDPDDPHHLIIENLPFLHEHQDEAETLALNIAQKATLQALKTSLVMENG
jgi:hypothetical protein